MDRRIVNPWMWQDNFGFVQGHEVTGAQRVLYCAGQTSTDADGRTLHPEDMGAQLRQALDNLETVLREAGMDLSNVARLTMYTTDVDRFLASYHVAIERFSAADCRPAATLLGVARLAFPDLLLELEATAVA
ncbi:MAG TPA: RidA family protein [Chloroflexota bacterium]|nr:RidA family protein [Chloroflexota bacterium]